MCYVDKSSGIDDGIELKRVKPSIIQIIYDPNGRYYEHNIILPIMYAFTGTALSTDLFTFMSYVVLFYRN